MTLKKYINDLQKWANEYPDLQVVYSCDEEGNRFSPVFYSPVVGEFKNGNEFDTEFSGGKPNAICIN